jgi:hypothetical protein
MVHYTLSYSCSHCVTLWNACVEIYDGSWAATFRVGFSVCSDMFQDRQCTCNTILWHFPLKFIPPHLNSIIQFHSNLCLWQQWVLSIVELNIIALEMQQCISFILQTHICRCQQHKYWMHCHGNATMRSLWYCCWAKTFVMFIPPWLS